MAPPPLPPPSSSKSLLEVALQEAQRETVVGAAAATTTTINTNPAIPSSTSTNAKNSVAVSSVAPKKINWDLKRDISDKLAKLERRTQTSIVEMLKERLELEASQAISDDDDDDDDDDLD
jgi:coiled-coil domain-containing protein 12